MVVLDVVIIVPPTADTIIPPSGMASVAGSVNASLTNIPEVSPASVVGKMLPLAILTGVPSSLVSRVPSAVTKFPSAFAIIVPAVAETMVPSVVV